MSESSSTLITSFTRHDFPTSISVSDHLEKLREDLGGTINRSVFQRQFYNPNGSINSLTFFAGAVLADYPGYMLLDANTYYRQPAQASLRRPFIGQRQQEFRSRDHSVRPGIRCGLRTSHQNTREVRRGKIRRQVAVLYWLARFYGQQGDATNATALVEASGAGGWKLSHPNQIRPCFAAVQEDPAFQALVARIPDLPFDFIPTQGFKHESVPGVSTAI